MNSNIRIAIVSVTTVAAIVHLLNTGYADWSAGANMAYVLVLVGAFFKPETVNDERVRELKLKAMFVAFLTGWAVVGGVRFASYLQDRSRIPWTMSAYDAMFIMLLTAFALFQYWRWQDGRVQGENAG